MDIPDSRILGQGKNRVCIRPDSNSQLCLKLDATAALNRLEMAAWLELRNKNLDDLTQYFSPCFALEMTPWGEALLCEAAVDLNGNLAPSLLDVLSGRSPTQDCQEASDQLCLAVDRFTNYLIRHDIRLFDLNPGNFSVIAEAGGFRLLCIDVKSLVVSKELLPVGRYFKSLAHRKIVRRSHRLKERIRLSLASNRPAFPAVLPDTTLSA